MTAPMPPRPVPSIAGWDVTENDGLLIANRLYELTEYQVRWGALDEVHARDEGELILLCGAHTRLAERLGTAERLHPRVEPPLRKV